MPMGVPALSIACRLKSLGTSAKDTSPESGTRVAVWQAKSQGIIASTAYQMIFTGPFIGKCSRWSIGLFCERSLLCFLLKGCDARIQRHDRVENRLRLF